ncbi:MAG: hypothetical protein R2830_15620 [Saprospiraceae bacterium]
MKATCGDPFLPLNCPADLTIHPDPGQCIAFVEFDSLIWSHDVTVANFSFTPGPTSPFEYGNTPVDLTVIDLDGNVNSCTFIVTVEPNTYTLICDDFVTVYLGQDCTREVTPFMILQGGPYDCEEAYSVDIINPEGGYLGNIVDLSFLGADWSVKVEDNYSGNYCWGSILVVPDSIGQTITCPPNNTVLCHEPYGPGQLGTASVETCLDSSDYTITYTDVLLNSFCNGDNIAFQVHRNWKVTNIFDKVTTCQQTITALRVSIFDLTFPPDFDGIDEPPLSCNDTLSYPALADTSRTGVPTINGLNPAGLTCSIVMFYTDSVTHICGERYKIEREWKVIDFCTDEQRILIQTILIEDVAGPQFEVPPMIPASNLTDCGPSITLPPLHLLHECSGFDVEIRTPWDTLYTDGGILEVPVSAGSYNLVYVATDDCGNIGYGTSILSFNSNVIASCPDNTTVNCNFYREELKPALDAGETSVLQQFGQPVLNANCGFLNITETVDQMIDTCSSGHLFRTMSVTANGQTQHCIQDIGVATVSDFVVEFPADTTVTCSAGTTDFGEPVVHGADCENIQVTYSDEVFTVVQDACYKIIRTWVVTNACVAGDSLDDEVAEKPESLLGLPFPACDLDGDGDCDNHTFRDSWTENYQPGPADAQTATGIDTDPDSDPWDGYITYQQVIKVIDYVDPIFSNQCQLASVCVDDQTCNIGYYLPTPPIDDCSPIVSLTAQLLRPGGWAMGFGPHQDLAPGSYPVRYVALDQCNNQESCETTLVIEDCAPPTAVCQAGLDIDLIPPDGITVVNASDLNNFSTDNCPGTLRFSYSSNVYDTLRTFTCDSLGLRTATLYVTDAAGNQASCTAGLEIIKTSFQFECEPLDDYPISGFIKTPENEGIANVEVAGQTGTSLTDANGFYLVYSQNLPATVAPYKNNDPLNGVTTFDIVLLNKHILGVQPLNSPYKIIAADVNNSKTVTTFDAVLIRQLILNIIQSFPNNTSWRFVPAGYVFPNPGNPFDPPFPETMTASSSGNPANLNFTGIKTGDLNGSVVPNFSSGPVDRNLAGPYPFSLHDITYKTGEIFTLPFYADKIPVLGWQFALAFEPDQAEFLQLVPGFVPKENFNLQEVGKGGLRTSWNSLTPFLPGDEPAFSLVFKARTDGRVSDWLHLDEEALPDEAYSENLRFMNVQLLFQAKKPGREYTLLYPARPNPFDETTALPFYLPEKGLVTFTFSDVSGKVVLTKKAIYEKGVQSLVINAGDLPGPSLYIYSMETSWGNGQGKIVLH